MCPFPLNTMSRGIGRERGRGRERERKREILGSSTQINCKKFDVTV